MHKRWGVLWGLLWTAAAQAQGQVYGIAGKSRDDPNFEAAARGCAAEARLQGDRCIDLAPSGPARARAQDAALGAALTHPLSGLAVSVTNSHHLARSSLARAAAAGVPVVTFDSDLEPAHQRLRRAYVGPDNAAIGRQLATLAGHLRPGGGTVCLLSADARDPNLAERIAGVRRGLAQDRTRSADARLDGARGWREAPRCPWFNADDPERAVRQLARAFANRQADIVVSVGAWPIVQPDSLRHALEALPPQQRGRILVVSGALSPPQQALLNDGLIDGVVTLDFEQMGRQAYRLMKRLAAGLPVDPVVHTGAVAHGRP